WEGKILHVVYEVKVPSSVQLGRCPGALHVMVGGLAVGEVRFELHVEEQETRDTRGFFALSMSEVQRQPNAVAVDVLRFRNAFVSYARKDIAQVLLYAEALDDAGIKVLLDLTDIEPGAQWETKRLGLIAQADVFYLMWSHNAAQSPWVEKESRAAV